LTLPGSTQWAIHLSLLRSLAKSTLFQEFERVVLVKGAACVVHNSSTAQIAFDEECDFLRKRGDAKPFFVEEDITI